MNRLQIILSLATLAWLVVAALIVLGLRWPGLAVDLGCALAAGAITVGLFGVAVLGGRARR